MRWLRRKPTRLPVVYLTTRRLTLQFYLGLALLLLVGLSGLSAVGWMWMEYQAEVYDRVHAQGMATGITMCERGVQ